MFALSTLPYSEPPPLDSSLRPCLCSCPCSCLCLSCLLCLGMTAEDLLRILVVGPGWSTALQPRTLRPPKDDASRLRVRRPIPNKVVATYFFLQFVESVCVNIVGLITISNDFMLGAMSISYGLFVSFALALFLDQNRFSWLVHIAKCAVALMLFLPQWRQAFLLETVHLDESLANQLQLGLSALQVAGLTLSIAGMWS
eukprot:m.75357 g.75357  ORF g.75357 m.75357 type:complete len:199 (-) comp13973_c1_seq2:33-629(-)